jgi:Flp pilus assembly protein TadG
MDTLAYEARRMLLNLKNSTFAKDCRGNVAMTFGFSLMVVGLCAGGGLDFGRQRLAFQQTQSAMDAAVLAGARYLQTNPDDVTGAITMATNTYSANVESRIPVVVDTVQFVTADDDTAITAKGTAAIPTTLLVLAGISELPIVPATASEFPRANLSVGGSGGSDIEVAVMLDVTGSMCDDGAGPCTKGSKLDGLKAAAADLVKIVVSADQSKHTSRVALVPFSTRVRVGPDGGGAAMMKKLTDLDDKMSFWYNICTDATGGGASEGSGNWQCLKYELQHVENWKVMPCVTDRFYNSGWQFDATDDAPGSGRWLNAHDGSRNPESGDSSDTPLSSGTGKNKSDPTDNWNYEPNGSCADTLSGNEILPLTSDKDALNSRIGGLQAYGGTAGALGTAWSWYMLSPKWSNIWSSASKPGPYSDLTSLQANGAPYLRKIAVLMTDGGFNTFRGWKDQDQQQVSNWAIQTCTNMKAKGIEIFTVGFALDQLPASQRPIAEATLKACGTDVTHFYQSLTVNELQTAFRSIALKLAGLRLTK